MSVRMHVVYVCVYVSVRCRQEDRVWIMGRQRALVYWSIGILALCLADRGRVSDCVTQKEKGEEEEERRGERSSFSFEGVLDKWTERGGEEETHCKLRTKGREER